MRIELGDHGQAGPSVLYLQWSDNVPAGPSVAIEIGIADSLDGHPAIAFVNPDELARAIEALRFAAVPVALGGACKSSRS